MGGGELLGARGCLGEVPRGRLRTELRERSACELRVPCRARLTGRARLLLGDEVRSARRSRPCDGQGGLFDSMAHLTARALELRDKLGALAPMCRPRRLGARALTCHCRAPLDEGFIPLRLPRCACLAQPPQLFLEKLAPVDTGQGRQMSADAKGVEVQEDRAWALARA